jgi:hypothetical protein
MNAPRLDLRTKPFGFLADLLIKIKAIARIAPAKIAFAITVVPSGLRLGEIAEIATPTHVANRLRNGCPSREAQTKCLAKDSQG